MEDDDQHYSFLVPVIKSLLEKSKDQLHLTSQLPSLNLAQSQQAAVTFYNHFKTYQGEEEWRYFVDKKTKPGHDAFQAGFLANLPQEMDLFWAECYESSKVSTHKRSRIVGESKLKFQARYMEPYLEVVKAEVARFSNVQSQQKSHLSFITKR